MLTPASTRLRRVVAFAAVAGALLFGCVPEAGLNGTRSAWGDRTDPLQLVTLQATPFQLSAVDGPAGEICSSAERWLEEIMDTVGDEDRSAYATELADSDDLYQYSRALHTYIVSLLTAYRLTGDDDLLAEVDRLAEIMRSHLDDSWRDTDDNRSRGRDGYRNWVWRGSNRDHRGKDLNEIDEMRTHALVAEFAWAFETQRGTETDDGTDYGERADFWKEYLREDFEAKWRERKDVPWPKFPFMGRPYVHETVSFIKYHYYMYRLTEREEYLREAKRLTDIVLAEFQEVETDEGPALVWTHALVRQGGDREFLQPTTYARYVFADAVDLHLEGFDRWADPELVRGLANTLAQFIIDEDEMEMARDIGGGERRAGLRPSSDDDWSGPTYTQYAISPFALLAAWDESGIVVEFSERVHERLDSDQRSILVPAGLLLAAATADCGTTLPEDTEMARQ